MKRSIDIEQLLTWAYVDELPKRALSSAEANWENISQFGGMGGTAIDTTPQRYATIGAPHPDAVMIEHQVNGLGALLGFDGPVVSVHYLASKPALFSDMPFMAPNSLSLPAFNIVALVKSKAVLRTRPRWNVGIMRPQRTLAANGRPVVIGLDNARRYKTGAHCPLTWAPTSREIAEARAEYMLWHRALTELAHALTDSLVAHAPMLPQAPDKPWHAQAEARKAAGTIFRNPLVTAAVLAAARARRRRRPIAAV